MSVDTASVLEWLNGILKDHYGRPEVRGSDPLLVASALPERERWISLIREALEAEEGVLVDATDCGRGVDCGDLLAASPALVEAINQLLDRFNTADGHAELRLDIEAGRARVLGAQDYESVNAAQRALREVMTAICSDSVRATDLTALSYAEDALDETHVHDIWQLLMQLPSLLGLEPQATINIIAGDGQVDFDTHCAGDPSLRYRLREDGGFQRRHQFSVSSKRIRDLSRYGKDAMPLLVLVLGAGASVADGLQTGDALRDQALGALTKRTVDRLTFEEVAREWWSDLAPDDLTQAELAAGVEDFVRTLTLERVLAHEQRIENQNFSATLRAFAKQHKRIYDEIEAKRQTGKLADDPLKRLVECQQRLVLVTVNFDRVIEARVGPNSVEQFITEAQLADFNSYLEHYRAGGGPVPLLKLHGDIDQPDTIVANIDQTIAGLSSARDNALLSLITTMEKGEMRPWWYLGYSMRDRDLEVTWKSPRFLNFQEYWVSPFLDPSVEKFITDHRLINWERKGRGSSPIQKLISLTAKDFFDVLAREVTEKW